MLAPGGEIESPSAFGRLLVDSLRLYPEFVRELSETTGVFIDYLRCGAIESAESGQGWEALIARARVQAEMGVRSEPCAERSLFYPDDAIVDPVHVLQALRAACLQLGVELMEGSPVERLDNLNAQAVVLSAGAWSGGIAGVNGIPKSFPVKGHLIGYGLPAGSLGPVRRCGHTYLLQRQNGFTVAGSTTEHVGFDTNVNRQIVKDVRSRAETLYPVLRDVAPARCWIGFRPGIETPEPAIGQFEDSRYWLAYGHYRNGILAAPATAHRIADGVTSSLGTALSALRNNP